MGNFYVPYTDRRLDPNEILSSFDPTINAPDGLDTWLPVWGSGKLANYYYQHDDLGRGILYTLAAASDVFAIRALATGIGKAVVSSGAKAIAEGSSHTIYRVVSKSEASDVLANGFRQAPISSKISSYEGKLFWSSIDDANWFKSWKGADDVILEVNVNGNFIYENGYDAGRLFYYISPERVDTFNAAIKAMK